MKAIASLRAARLIVKNESKYIFVHRNVRFLDEPNIDIDNDTRIAIKTKTLVLPFIRFTIFRHTINYVIAILDV